MRTKESPEQSLKDFSCKRTLLLLLRIQAPAGRREGSQREGQAHRGRPMPRPSVRTAPAPSRNALRGLRLSATPGCEAQPLTAKPGGSCGSPRPAAPATPPAARLLPAALPDGAASAGMTRTDAGARPCRAKAGDLPPGTPAKLQPHHTELLQPPAGPRGHRPRQRILQYPLRPHHPEGIPGSDQIGPAQPPSASPPCTRPQIATDSASPTGAGRTTLTGRAGGAGRGPAAGAEGTRAGAATATYRLPPAPREGTDSPPVRTRRAPAAAP